ncbi:hypothetical protein [Teredinibacter haidensis]|uniref:hypothetical protein n=1 Tax=Teredinibacter haidensis TaxID=2731755 RepID=UPI00094901E4|nr:hypothetical protein [Teredinibacter haidensis]
MLGQAIQDNHGRYYRIHTSRDGIAPPGLAPVELTDPVSAIQFIRNLRAPESYWRQIVSLECLQSISSDSNQSMESRFATLVTNGRIRIFNITEAEVAKRGMEHRTFKGSSNTFMQLLPAASLLQDTHNGNYRQFGSPKAASDYISGFQLTETQLNKILSDMGATTPYIRRPDISALDCVAEEVAAGKIVVVEKAESSSSPKAESESSYPEAFSHLPGSRAVSLGPHVDGCNEGEQCTCCSIVNLNVRCAHGRSVGPSKIIRVVPTPDITQSSEYALMGVKISIKKEIGGTDVVTVSSTLKNNKSDKCHQLKIGDSVWKNERESDVEIADLQDKDADKWPINAKPMITNISGKGCDGEIKSVEIETYPSQYYTVEGNLDIFADWVDKVQKSWEKWGEKYFNASPVTLKPVITGPTGSFSASWGWKEDSDWNAFYDISTSFGLNPILGIELTLSVSMMTLAMTASGIPPSLSKLTADHLADILVSVGAGCKGMLQGSPHAKFYPEGTQKIDGQAKFTVEGGVKLAIKGRIGSDYIVSASLIVSGETKVTGEDVLDINREGVFAQTTFTLDPLIGVAKVEIKYLVIFTKSEEKKWVPWGKIELYKSDKIKVLPK